MAYNSKAIKTDVNAKPIPQYYNPVTDEYEVLQGVGGAARQVLYGPDGNPISVADNKLAVRAEELEAKIEALNAKLDGVIDGTTPAKTELTGSLVETYKAVNTVISNFTVAAGVQATIYTYNSNTDPVDMILVLVKAPSTESHDFSVYYKWYIGKYTAYAFSKLLCSSNKSYIAYTEEPIKVISPHLFDIQVKNNDTIDHTYELLNINYFYRRF